MNRKTGGIQTSKRQEAYAYALKDAGLSVHWFGGSGDDPTSISTPRLRFVMMHQYGLVLAIGNLLRCRTMVIVETETGESLSIVSNLPTTFDKDGLR